MENGQSNNRSGSPLLRELRRWERRSRHAERPGRARLLTWQQAVAAAVSDGDAEAPRLAASLRTILRLGVAARLTDLEQLVNARRPLSSMVLAPREAATMRSDLDAAAGLGGRVGRYRAELATLLGAQLSAHLLWLENETTAASPERTGEFLPQTAGLWADFLEAEAQGAPEMAALRERLSRLQRALETIQRTASSGREDLADLASDAFALASRPESPGGAVLKAWVDQLVTQFADRAGWEEFVAELRTLAHGEAGTTKEASVPAPIGDAAGHALLPAALAQVLDFVRDQDERTAAFVANLVSARRAQGDYPTLEMPFVTRTEIQLDWLEGQPDPWSSAEAVERSRTAAQTMLAQGVEIRFVPGHPLSREQYDERLARQSGEFSLPGKSGQVSLAGLDVLERSVLIAQGQSRLEVLLPPARAALPSSGRGERPARRFASALAGLAPTSDLPGASVPPVSLPGGFGPSAGISGGPTPPIKLRLDWVAGHDPWLQPDTLARAEAVAAQFAGQGVQLVFVRGREVPLTQYVVGQGQRAGEFVVQGARGPVPLAGLEILQQAELVAQRPGLLHVILPPTQASGSPTGADESVRGVLDWAAPSERGSSINPAVGGKQGELAQLQRPGPVRVRLDWVAGADPWRRPESLAQAREAARALAASGVRLQFVRGREVPIEQYTAGTGLRSADFVVLGSRAPVSLGEVALLNEAVPVNQRPGLLHVILAPGSGHAAKAPLGQDRPMLAHTEGRVRGHAERSEASPRATRSDTVAVATMNLGPAVPPAPTGFSFAAGRLMQLMPMRMDPTGVQINPPTATEGHVGRTTAPEMASLLASRLMGSGRDYSVGREAGRYGLTPPPLQSHGAASLVNPDILSGTVASSGAADATTWAKGATASPDTSQQVRLELDWIAGQDPWQQPLVLAAARRAASDLEGSGVRLEFVRGRELPPERYAADMALSTGALGLIGPAGPVSLANMSLLDRAVLLEQRPSLLHLLLAPTSTPPGRIGVGHGITGTAAMREQSLSGTALEPPMSGTYGSTATAAERQAPNVAPSARSLPAMARSDGNSRLGLSGSPSWETAADGASWPSWPGNTPDMPVVARWFTAGMPRALTSVDRTQEAGPLAGRAGTPSHSLTARTREPRPGTGPRIAQDRTLPLARQAGREQLATAESNRPSASASSSITAQPVVATSTAAGALDSHGGSGAPRTDMDALSRQIYSMIKQRLAVERERMGRHVGRHW